ncbi:Spt20 protein [Maudiozyma humilis]|uniref:Spt20 protein n=1 Tax=Maudiozyma humilis TaxID=51915 RepID=A0AAV5S0G4_MAUHU|nr:Spt20 protein [Kazachstania humilis]
MSAVNSPGADGHGVGIAVNTPGNMSSPGASTPGAPTRTSSNNSGRVMMQGQGSLPGPGGPAMVNGGIGAAPGTPGTPLTPQLQQQQLQQLTPMQRQKLMLQQRMMQQQRQQQQLLNFRNQFFQLMSTINRAPKRVYNFAEDTDALLKKYEQYRPSFEFHIYENNYKLCTPQAIRNQQQQQQQLLHQQQNGGSQQQAKAAAADVSNDGLVLNKNNEVLKEFLEYVARGTIPEAIMEVIADCDIQLYEGNVILQVYDHMNTVDVAVRVGASASANSSAAPAQPQPSSSETTISDNPAGNPAGQTTASSTGPSTTAPAAPPSIKKPRVYRTLLRPNDLSGYYDMMAFSDHTRFSDSIYQQLEAEILSLTKRNVNLDVTLDPYQHRDKLDPASFSEPQWDDAAQKLNFQHRPLSTREGTKGRVGHIPEHEELPQHNSTYEQMMLIMSERTSTITSSAFAAALAKHATEQKSGKSGSGNASGSGGSGSGGKGRNGTGSGSGSGSGGGSSSAEGSQVSMATAAASTVATDNNQFSRLKFIEQYRVNKEKRKQQQALNMANGNVPLPVVGAPFNQKISMAMTGDEQNMSPQKQRLQKMQKQAAQAKGGKKGAGANSGDKPKPKRPRKPKKAAATAAGGEAAPKKRRVTKKKAATTANAGAGASTPVASTPGATDAASVAGTPASFNSAGSPPSATPK